MADKVFVNGRAAVHKKSSMKSIGFPDVCLCPPSPPAGPIPAPLPNMAQAADLDGGASSVLIEGSPMGKKSSFFAKSTGDEVAKNTGGNVVTHVVQGKAEFQSYSMDVLVEGEEAVRALDLMTHNHASPPAGTPPVPLIGPLSLSLAVPARAASKDKKKEEKKEEEEDQGRCWCDKPLQRLFDNKKLGTKSTGSDVAKLHEHLIAFGFAAELGVCSTDGKVKPSADQKGKTAWGKYTARALRMFASHPQVGAEPEAKLTCDGSKLTPELIAKIRNWCEKKVKSPQNYWEYRWGTTTVSVGNRDAYGSRTDASKQTLLHDYMCQIERDLAATGFALHADQICGLRAAARITGGFATVAPAASGRHEDRTMKDQVYLVRKFQRQAQWLWRMRKDGTHLADATSSDPTYFNGALSGVLDAETMRCLHEWASRGLHMVINKFALKELHWPPGSSTIIRNEPAKSAAQLRADAYDAWLRAAVKIEQLGGTLQGPYTSAPRGWRAGKLSKQKGNVGHSRHYSALAIDICQALCSGNGKAIEIDAPPPAPKRGKKPPKPPVPKPYVREKENDRFRLWCRISPQRPAPADPSLDTADPVVQYRNRNIKALQVEPSRGQPVLADNKLPAATKLLCHVTSTTDATGKDKVRVTVPEGWYLDMTEILQQENIYRIGHKNNWVTVEKEWEWWHYQYKPTNPPGVSQDLVFGDYLQLFGVHEYRLRTAGDGWPAHEDIEHALL